MKPIFLSIIIPAYNEADRISDTLRAIDQHMRTKTYSYEIIVVNDGSTDATSQVVKNISRNIKNFKYVDNTENHGKGWVVQQGMLEAEGEYRLFTDADNSTPIHNIDRFLEKIQEGHDIIISSRSIEGAVRAKPQGKLRQFLGTIFRTTVHTVVPLGIVDTQNGFKLFTKNAVETVFRKQQTYAWAFDVEILAIAIMFGLRIKEEPITWTDDERTHVTFKGMVRMLKEVVIVKKNIYTGVYGTYHADLGDPRTITVGKFMIFGFVNTIVDWAWFIALTQAVPFFGHHIIIAKGLAFIVASIPVFLGNVYWVFPRGEFSSLDHAKLYGILASAFVINTFSVVFFTSHGINLIVALVLATVMSFIWNLSIAWFLLIKDQVFFIQSSSSFE